MEELPITNPCTNLIITHLTTIVRDQTRVLVTHATQFLPRCDRVILLSKGSVIDQGPYEQVYERNPVFHGILKELIPF